MKRLPFATAQMRRPMRPPTEPQELRAAAFKMRVFGRYGGLVRCLGDVLKLLLGRDTERVADVAR